MMVGRTLNEMFPKENVEIGDEFLRVENLCLLPNSGAAAGPLRDISFTLRKGEILGVAGLMGAGRTELLETLFGVYPPSRVSGKIILNQVEHSFNNPQEAIAAGIAFVTEDRKTQSLILKMSVGNNITLAALENFLRLSGHPAKSRKSGHSGFGQQTSHQNILHKCAGG